MLHHVILTRFNLATPGREESIRNRPGWLSRRFELFEKHCLPSIQAQTNQDFTWIIYFDEDTPPEFKARIDQLTEQFPFVPFYTGLFPSDGWHNSVKEVLQARGIAPEWLLTTRLDNDDALANDYTLRVRNAAEQGVLEKKALNFKYGCIVSGNRIYKITHESNAFFSLLERYDSEFVTAPAIQHMQLAEHARVEQIEGAAGWLQIVHGENVSNKVRGVRIFPKSVEDRFSDDAIKALPTPSSGLVMLENSILFPMRAFRDGFLTRVNQMRRAKPN